jgi:hypothetical protein
MPKNKISAISKAPYFQYFRIWSYILCIVT